MAFKMKGYSPFDKQTGIGGVQAEKDLQEELKSMATGKSKAKTKEPTMSYEEWSKKNPGTARYLTKKQYEAKVKKLKSGLKHVTQDVNHDHTGDGTVDDPTATGSDNPMYQQGKKRLPPMSTSPFGPLFP